MHPSDAAAAVARPIGSFGTRFMFDPATYSNAQQFGFTGLDFYFTGRCGVLGDAPADVVAATLGFFDAAMVDAMWSTGRAVTDPLEAARLFGDACGQWGVEHFGDGPDYDDLAELAGRIAGAADVAGVPLAAGWRAMPTADDPRAAVAQRLNVLRELRGGFHLVAVVSAGLTPLQAVLLTGGEANAQLFGHAGPYPDVSGLGPTRDAVEAATNEMTARAFATLDADELDRFVTLVAATRSALVT